MSFKTLCLDVTEGRMQAYGWSLPAKYSTEVAEGGKSFVSVPVPVYCRPLNLNDPGMKVSMIPQTFEGINIDHFATQYFITSKIEDRKWDIGKWRHVFCPCVNSKAYVLTISPLSDQRANTRNVNFVSFLWW